MELAEIWRSVINKKTFSFSPLQIVTGAELHGIIQDIFRLPAFLVNIRRHNDFQQWFNLVAKSSVLKADIICATLRVGHNKKSFCWDFCI